MDCNLPACSVHGILQAKILDWVAMPSSRGSSDPWIEPMSPALQVDSLLLSHGGSPSVSLRVSELGLAQFTKMLLSSSLLLPCSGKSNHSQVVLNQSTPFLPFMGTQTHQQGEESC